MKKKFFNLFLILLLFFIYFIICANSYSTSVSSNISSSIFRLHVIANSDSLDDQNLKYLVRNNIINYMNSLIDISSSKENALKIANENLDKFQEIAQKTVQENGYNYPVTVEIGNFYFPTKDYGDISFPSGYYDGLKIKIGKAEGRNWWCVMFPPLCFVDLTSGIVPEESKENLEETLDTEEYAIISEKSDEIKFKFKIIEIFEDFKQTYIK